MIKDTYQLNGFSQTKLPKLKGHLKLVLKDIKTGRVDKVVEGDNVVTNAVKDIFGDMPLGSATNYSSMLPLWSNWYRGILCYKYAHDTDNNDALDPNNYYPKDSTTNPVTAHAGDAIPSDTTDDVTRGSPSTIQTLTSNSVTIGWEWGASQGNGQISALSLCHKDTGNAGLGSTSNAFKSFQPLLDLRNSGILPNATPSNTDTTLAQYDDANALYFHQGEEGEYYGGHYGFASNKITLYLRKLAYRKTGLIQTILPDTSYNVKATITTSVTFYSMPCWYFDYANKKLWLFSNMTSANGGYSSSVVNYCVLDISDMSDITEDSHGTITSDTSNLAPIGFTNSNYRSITNIIKQGNYVYFPTTSGVNGVRMNWNGMKKINISNQSDQTSISFNTPVSSDTRTLMVPAFEGFDCGGLIIGNGNVVNGTTGYACSALMTMPDPNGQAIKNFISVAFHSPSKPISLLLPIANAEAYFGVPKWIVANKMVNTTLYNLPSTVTKTSAQSMSVTYTLTEVSS